MYNKVILAGNLSRDIEIRYTSGGSAIGNTAIATTRRYKAQDGSKKEETLFVDITLYGRTAEIANQYLHKGSKVLIDGRLKFEQWTDQQGQKRSKHKVDVESLQMIDANEGSSRTSEPARSTAPNTQQTKRHAPTQRPQQPHHHEPQFPEMSEEIPF